MERIRKERILQLVRDGEVEYIGARVEVEFDNLQQVPLGFRHGGRHYEVLELIRAEQPSPLQYHYLVQTVHGVFNLVLARQDPDPGISPSSWWLDFRVKDRPGTDGREQEAGSLGPGVALVRGELLGVVSFHGHLCPELALGYRAALIARARLGFGRQEQGAQTVMMYASSSAVDAVQYLTGCTVGKGNLMVDHTGDHLFCFVNRKGRLLLKVLPGILDKPPEFQRLEAELELGRKLPPHDLTWYQAEVDRLVKRILESPDEALFAQVLLTT